MKKLLVYSPLYRTFSYGPHHPLRPTRLYLTHVLMDACGLLEGNSVEVVEHGPADTASILRVHSSAYLEILEQVNSGESLPDLFKYGLGYGDNPVFGGVFDWSMLATGGSLEAVRAVSDGRAAVSFHSGGGFHHAHYDKAAGFCYLNDLAIAIAEQVEKGKKVLYLDIDAHHGDGVQEAFYDSDRVLTISIHESGDYIFPGSGYSSEIGEGKGEGYSVNVSLAPGTSDKVYTEGFEEVVPGLIGSFEPDFVVMQLGVDTMMRDPLGHLMYTTTSLEHTINRVMELHSGGIMASGGGGYEMDTVARCWTLAWGLLSGAPLQEELPDVYVKERARYGATGAGQKTLRDPLIDPPPDQEEQLAFLHKSLEELRKLGVI